MPIVTVIQGGLNSLYVLYGLIIFLWKIKYLNFLDMHIARFFIVTKKVFNVVLIITFVSVTFAYAYRIMYVIESAHLMPGTNIGVIFKSFNFIYEETFRSLW